jgi:hypothetical protein
MSRAHLSAAVLVFSLVAGCSVTVAGQPVRTPPSAVEWAMPNSAELGRALGLTMTAESTPQVGGIDAIRDDKAISSPMRCAGVTHAGFLPTFRGAPIRAASRGFWNTPQSSDDRVDVVVSVVELDSPSSAQSWYTRTVAQWERCRGVTVTERTGSVSFIQTISNVRDFDHTLTAELSVWTDNGIMAPRLNRRAFTVTSQYLIDAEAFGTLNVDASDLNASAITHLVAGKIS